MAKVTMPQLGESVAEGTIGKWLKQPGDHVDKYEPLVEVITDKVNAEVPSPFEGILREILAEEGATVPNNAEIAVIETADERRARPTAAGACPDGPDGDTTAAASEPAQPTARRLSPRRRSLPTQRGRATGRGLRSALARGRGTPAHRRSGRPNDPGGPPAPARARPVGRADRGHRRRRPDHP